jgi:maltodextrin utilization protein YvdJ
MLTQKQYEALSKKAKEKLTDKDKERLEEYENFMANADNHSGTDNPTNNSSNPTDNNHSDIVDLSKQSSKELEQELQKRERNAQYHQKKQMEDNKPDDVEDDSYSFLSLVGGFVVVGAFLVFLLNKLGILGDTEQTEVKKVSATENRMVSMTESSSRDTEQNIEQGSFT